MPEPLGVEKPGLRYAPSGLRQNAARRAIWKKNSFFCSGRLNEADIRRAEKRDSVMDSRELTTAAKARAVAACACTDFAAEFVIGTQEFVGKFEGQISARLGVPLTSTDRLATIPLHIIGYTTSSDVPGMGRTTLDFDFSRPIETSELAGSREREFFPAIQTMRLHILVSTDAFKGKLLRSISPGALRNRDAPDFPPPMGSTYTLEHPVLLEDIAHPGVSVATLKTVNTSIVSTQIYPEEIATNEGFTLYFQGGKSGLVSEQSGEFEVTYQTSLPGAIALALFDESGRSRGIALRQIQTGGRQSIRIPNSLWQGRATFYQISVDGLPRTALMPIG